MKIVFIRHLRTPGNEKRQYIGRTDESLSERAVEEFYSSKNRYPAVKSVVASPMKRCIETARLIYPEAEIRTEPLLRECSFGLFEGKSYEELKAGRKGGKRGVCRPRRHDHGIPFQACGRTV